MNIQTLENYKNRISIFDTDENGRKIDVYLLEDVFVASDTSIYPGIVLGSGDNLYNPYFEKVMSLGDYSEQPIEISAEVRLISTFEEPVFYFVYNSDNYYHFVYDTLPYLITYKHLKKQNLVKKILVSFPSSRDFYPFFWEFLKILEIEKEDLVSLDRGILYKKIYISDSYTHGHNSNLPPRQEIFKLYDEIKNVVSNLVDINSYPKKIYISRRSWIHGDYSNIGTNYTQRRKLIIEDELVKFLESEGFTEIFTEKLSTNDKIGMMMGSEMVIGAIGGGLCNLLFANSECKSVCVCSPHFLSINSRFIFSFSGGTTSYFFNSFNTESNRWKRYMRIKWGNRIGEIKEVKKKYLVVNFSKSPISGWNNDDTFEEIKVLKEDATPLDEGLNSEWSFDLEDFIKFYNNLI